VRDGTGGQRLQFACIPVSAVLSLIIDGIAIPPAPPPSPSTGLTASYVFSPTQLSVRGYYFTRRPQNVVVTYTAGYTSTPPEIAQACIELVALRYRERMRIGEVSKSLGGGETVTYARNDMSAPIATILQQYRAGGAGRRLLGRDGANRDRHGNPGGGGVITVDLIGDESALDRLRAMPDAARSGLARAIAKPGVDLQNNVQQDKLSGQVLKTRSGLLKSSIDVQTDQSNTAITAIVFTDVDYAAAQEYGFSGTVNVRASLRQIKERLVIRSPQKPSACAGTAAGRTFPSVRSRVRRWTT
jgi:hypothetical protein